MNLALKRTTCGSAPLREAGDIRSTSDQGLKLIRAVKIRISARNDRPPAGQRCRPTRCLVTRPVRNCITFSLSAAYTFNNRCSRSHELMTF